jgi:DUF2934 family protein
MQYLVAQMLMCLLIAGLMGLLTGWLLWGMLVRRARERVMEMEQRVSRLSGYPAMLTDLEGTHAAFVASKNEESAKYKARVVELENLVAIKDKEIAAHVEAHADKDVRLESLLKRNSELTREVEAGGSLQMNLEPREVRGVPVSPRFYEAVPVAAIESQTPAPPDPAREFEKRVEASKDAEIEKLRNHLADIEKQPDPDVRRQILLSGKNAELTHLRGILNSLFQPFKHEEIAQRAYSYAEERGFAAGSPTEDWVRAERDSHFGRLAWAWESTRGGAMF